MSNTTPERTPKEAAATLIHSLDGIGVLSTQPKDAYAISAIVEEHLRAAVERGYKAGIAEDKGSTYFWDNLRGYVECDNCGACLHNLKEYDGHMEAHRNGN